MRCAARGVPFLHLTWRGPGSTRPARRADTPNGRGDHLGVGARTYSGTMTSTSASTVPVAEPGDAAPLRPVALSPSRAKDFMQCPLLFQIGRASCRETA